MTKPTAEAHKEHGDQRNQGRKCTTTQRATKTALNADEEVFEVIVPITSGSDYAEQIKAYRKKRGLTQKELGERLGVEEGTIRSWEKGYSKPRYHIWRGYKEKLDMEDV